MAFDYSIGGTDRKDEGSEAISELPLNRTLFVQKLTGEAPFTPQLVTDLKTVDEVFEHFKPEVEVEYETEEGTSQPENLRFGNLGDFGSSGIKRQSKYLSDLTSKEDNYLKIVKELKSNKALQTIVQGKDTKQALMSSLQAMIKELEEAGA